MGLFFDVVQF